MGTAGLGGNTDLAFSAYFRKTKYKESVPSSLIHRGYDLPGFSLQVNHHSGEGRLKNHLSVGADLGWQNIDEYKRPNLGNAVEGPDKISNQTYSQSGAGVFVLDRVDLGPQWGVSLSLRYDKVTNKLDDILKAGGLDFSGDRSFKKATGRIGVTYNPLSSFGLYASWGTGFLPPGTEELVNNPYAFSGFNMNLVPATSSGEEIGARGSIGDSFVYDLALFHLATNNDFGRYRVTWRPLETFYGNVGKSNRYGLETYLAWYPVEPLALRLAYTYSRFKYDRIETFEAGTVYKGTWLPNSPGHQAYLDAEYRLTSRIYAGASLEVMSRWFIDGTNKVSGGRPISSSMSGSAPSSGSAGCLPNSFSRAATFSARNTSPSPNPTPTAIPTSPRPRPNGPSASGWGWAERTDFRSFPLERFHRDQDAGNENHGQKAGFRCMFPPAFTLPQSPQQVDDRGEGQEAAEGADGRGAALPWGWTHPRGTASGKRAPWPSPARTGPWA